MDFQGCGLGISEYSGCFNLRENCTLRSVAASLKASGKLNVKARDLILYTDLSMYALYIVLKKLREENRETCIIEHYETSN